MQEILDFEFNCFLDPSKFWKPGAPEPEPIPDIPPPNKQWRDFRDTDGCSSLYYRGRRVKHIRLNGIHILAQYKCQQGFLLLTGYQGHALRSLMGNERGSVTYGYLLEDFSGLHWGELYTRWRCMKDPANVRLDDSRVDCNPIRSLEVEGEDRLLLTFKGGERYRFKVRIPPRRFFSTQDFINDVTYLGWAHERYLSVNRVLL